MTYHVEFFRTSAGDSPTEDFLESLPLRVKAKAGAWINLLQEKGPNLLRPYADVLEGPIRELRISFARLEIRLLYFIHGKSIVLTHGFMKKTEKVSQGEIDRALRYRSIWLAVFGG